MFYETQYTGAKVREDAASLDQLTGRTILVILATGTSGAGQATYSATYITSLIKAAVV